MNPRPPPCEGDALPAELLPHGAPPRRMAQGPQYAHSRSSSSTKTHGGLAVYGRAHIAQGHTAVSLGRPCRVRAGAYPQPLRHTTRAGHGISATGQPRWVAAVSKGVAAHPKAHPPPCPPAAAHGSHWQTMTATRPCAIPAAGKGGFCRQSRRLRPMALRCSLFSSNYRRFSPCCSCLPAALPVYPHKRQRGALQNIANKYNTLCKYTCQVPVSLVFFHPHRRQFWHGVCMTRDTRQKN